MQPTDKEIEAQARELLAAEFERYGDKLGADKARDSGYHGYQGDGVTLRAIVAALRTARQPTPASASEVPSEDQTHPPTPRREEAVRQLLVMGWKWEWGRWNPPPTDFTHIPAPTEDAEEWRSVAGYEGLYEVSSYGRARSVRKDRILSCKALTGTGYIKLDLWKDGKNEQRTLHRIICETFHGPGEDLEVNHKDRNKYNNRADNLEWVSSSLNQMHARYILNHLSNPVVAICASTYETIRFQSQAQAERVLGLHPDSVRRCLTGAIQSADGWFFKDEPETSAASGEGQQGEKREALHRIRERYKDSFSTSEEFLGERYTDGDILPAMQRLATWLWKRHYKEDAPQWEVCADAQGVLLQIDNMVSGLEKSTQQQAGQAVAWLITPGNDGYWHLTKPDGRKILARPDSQFAEFVAYVYEKGMARKIAASEASG